MCLVANILLMRNSNHALARKMAHRQGKEIGRIKIGDVAALVIRCHMSGSTPFKGTKQQTTEMLLTLKQLLQ